MSQNIAAYTAPGVAPDGEVVPFLSINREDDGAVSVTARDAGGQQVSVAVPASIWFSMARQIFISRSRLSMTVELGRRH